MTRASSRLAYVMLATLAASVALSSAARACDGEPRGACRADAGAAQVAREEAGQAGMWAYFDPKTGKVGPPPAEEMGSSAAEPHAASTSGAGLVVVPAPGGGQMIDLQGRFKMAVSATLKPDGAVETDCHPGRTNPAEAGGH